MLDFVANQSNMRDSDSVALLSGVISSSPWLRLSRSPPSWVVSMVGLISKVFPDMHFSTPVRTEVRASSFVTLIHCFILRPNGLM